MSDVPIGKIVITYWLNAEGQTVTNWKVKGDIPVVVQLGLLDMAKDGILHEGWETQND